MKSGFDVNYPQILDTIKPCMVKGRTESHSFLVWFLRNYYRLDETQAIDTVCDGPDDKGIDGIYVDENLESVVVFQCKLVQNRNRTLGDTVLKEFVGTLAQLREATGIDEIARTTANNELSRLLESDDVAKKVGDGYTVRGVFVTNIKIDQNGIQYLDGIDDLDVVDKSELILAYVPIDRETPATKPIGFSVFGYDCAEYQVADTKVLIAPLKGSELIKLDGIVTQELFASNVRGSLGRTKVNKDIGCKYR